MAGRHSGEKIGVGGNHSAVPAFDPVGLTALGTKMPVEASEDATFFRTRQFRGGHQSRQVQPGCRAASPALSITLATGTTGLNGVSREPRGWEPWHVATSSATRA